MNKNLLILPRLWSAHRPMHPPQSNRNPPPYGKNHCRPERRTKALYFAKIEGLAMLHQKGILTDNEFTSKKAELLSRL